jgi:putative PEP-CTERM system histidine kinase
MTLAAILAYVGALFAAALACGVLFQGRKSLAQWAFAAGMLVLALERIFEGFSCDALLPGEAVYWQGWRLWAASLLPGPWLTFSMCYARGNAKEFLLRWRVLLALAFVVPVLTASVFRGALILSPGSADSGLPYVFGLSIPGSSVNFLLLLSLILILMNLERTFRSSVGTMRWRIKFMVLGLVILFGVRAYGSSQVLLYHSVTMPIRALNSGALIVACLLIVRTLLRTGHFEVNLYPSHSLIHNSLTILLAGIYLIIVGALAKLVVWLGAGTGFQFQALLVLVLLVLLGVVLLSDRVRLYTKRFVSRHFQRPMYDYRSVWQSFTEATATRVEQNDLCATSAKLVSDLFQALSVTIWLLDERKEKFVFATSTSLSPTKAEQMSLDSADAAAIVRVFTERPEPVDLDSSKDFWAAALRRCHPDDFRKGGNRVCVPLVAGGELLGLMTLGDRVSGMQFSLQDLDLLKAAARQVAASLLNINLSQRLSQAKQLEAFQAMSAFFVHDLKNTASTLSLMLRNFPLHYQDPGFRADALRGIGQTVEHINSLISRLNLLRQELAVRPVDADLNEVVADSLKAHEQVGGISIEKNLQPLPKLHIDPSQIEKVITNLVLNARDASPNGGHVRIETAQRNGWAVLSVSDDGCGMTPEFLRDNLFRPFQTTKKRGIGIGMFHCKMIVEAHHGRMEVRSEPGKGTCFTVLLPLAA